MFTKTEKGYLVLTLAFLAAGTGIKAYRHAAVRLGPFQEIRQETRQETLYSRDTPEAPLTVLESGSVSPGGEAPRSDGRDSVSDSSNGSADPLSRGPASIAASDSHPTARPIMPMTAPGTPPRTASRTASKAAFNAKVDLNRAEASELTRVPGIGAKTAQAIVEYRRTHGPYRDFRDLLRIKGIGEKKLEKLKPNLIL